MEIIVGIKVTLFLVVDLFPATSISRQLRRHRTEHPKACPP